ncbi:MAG: SRPBCC domain-containing protein [Bacteroidia bacterium]|nr:SRPBCC domain-containing protein [Bacteroidia bacterium]
MPDRSQPVVVEQIIHRTVSDVWNAITDHSQMVQWYFDNIPAFEPTVGFQTSFNVKAPSRDFYHQWKVTEVVPENKIAYEWTFKDIPGDSLSTFEIEDHGDHVVLRVTAIGLDTLPGDIPEFDHESCLGGWNYFIKERLHQYLSI